MLLPMLLFVTSDRSCFLGAGCVRVPSSCLAGDALDHAEMFALATVFTDWFAVTHIMVGRSPPWGRAS
jgi:hypothetical protein